MNNTKTIKLCGIDYKIEKEKNIVLGGTECSGMIEYRTATIKLAKDLNKQVEKQTLWHECVHGILTGIGRDDLSDDETFVQSLAVALDESANLKIKSDPLLPFCNNDDEDDFEINREGDEFYD